MKNTNIMLLCRRIERNYQEYKQNAILRGGNYLFDNSDEITAVREAYSHATEYNWTGEETAGMLLKFNNPLKIIADEWREYKALNSDCFEDFAFDFARDFFDDADTFCPGDDEPDSGIKDDGFESYGLLSEILKVCEKHLAAKTHKLLDFDEDGFFIYEDDDDEGA